MEEKITQLEKKLEENQKELDIFEEQCGLPPLPEQFQLENRVHEILQMDWEDITNLSPKDKDGYAYTLANYSIHLQRHINKANSVLKYLESYIKYKIMDAVNAEKDWKYEARIMAAISKNADAKEAEFKKVKYEQRIVRLGYLVKQVNLLLQTLGYRNDFRSNS